MFDQLRNLMGPEVNREGTSKGIIVYALGTVSFLIMFINCLVILTVYHDLLIGERSFAWYLANWYDAVPTLEIIVLSERSLTEPPFLYFYC